MTHPVQNNPINPYYMPDTTTTVKRPKGSVAPTLPETSLRGRVLRALKKDDKSISQLWATIPLPPEPTKPAIKPLPQQRSVKRATNKPIGADYVTKRMNRCIAKAQNEQDYDEAIRLQHLLWELEDGKIKAVEVVREAWLRPAAANPQRFRFRGM